MKTKKSLKNKRSKFNYKLNKLLHKDTFSIQNDDTYKSIVAIYAISEYIRYSYFDSFYLHNPKKLSKYCRLLLHYERCEKPNLVKLCINETKKILDGALSHTYSVKSIDLSLSLSDSQYPSIKSLANNLMTQALSTKVRGVYT